MRLSALRPGTRAKSFVYAVLVHVAAVLVLIFSFNWPVGTGAPPTPKQPIVRAVAVDEAKVRQELERLKRRETERARRAREEQARLKRLLRKAAEAERRRKAEEARLAKLRKARKTEAEKAERVRKRRQAEEQRLAALKKKRAEAERRRKAQQARKRREAEQALKEALERERLHKRASAALSRYVPIIQQHVSRQWIEPPGAAKGLKSLLSVRLTPTGEVLAVRVIASSGDAVFDRSATNAVYKASPLPLPDDPAVAELLRREEIRFYFDPSKG